MRKTRNNRIKRREFLKTAAAGAAVFGALEKTTATVFARTRETRSRVFSTFGAQRLAEQPSALRFADKPNAALERIAVRPETEFQPILGFGAAFTDASCWLLAQLENGARASLMNELLAASELNLNVFRTCVAASDYGRTVYSYHDKEDAELKSFSIDYDRQYILPALKEARRINPDLFLFASPWSPPGWMKTSGSMLGGWMREKYLETYARYYVKYLEAYRAAGVEINALTTQNESETDQRGQMPATFWHPDFEIEFVKRLAPLLKKSNLKPKIWLIDHNYNLWQRANYQLDDPQLREIVAGVAWHPYVGTPDLIQKVAEKHPWAEHHQTEFGPFLNDGRSYKRYETEWAWRGAEIIAALENHCRSYVSWNVALDEKGQPNLGPFTCAGFVTINSKTQEITRSGQYWAMAHFSRFVKRGARRIETVSNKAAAKTPTSGSGDIAGAQADAAQFTLRPNAAPRAFELNHIAFENPAGEIVLVLMNPANTPAQTIEIEFRGRFAKLELPADSMTTVVLSD